MEVHDQIHTTQQLLHLLQEALKPESTDYTLRATMPPFQPYAASYDDMVDTELRDPKQAVSLAQDHDLKPARSNTKWLYALLCFLVLVAIAVVVIAIASSKSNAQPEANIRIDVSISKPALTIVVTMATTLFTTTTMPTPSMTIAI